MTMVTDLCAAIVADCLTAVRTEEFFGQGRGARASRIREALGDAYPASVRTYLAEVDGADFVTDIEQLAPLLGSRTSLFRELPRIVPARGHGNGLVAAVLDLCARGLRDALAGGAGSTKLGAFLASLDRTDATGAFAAVTMVRETQELLLAARGIDSPVVQLATALSADEEAALLAKVAKDGDGIPSVRVQPELLGGLRVFHHGEVRDASWSAKLSALFSHVQ